MAKGLKNVSRFFRALSAIKGGREKDIQVQIGDGTRFNVKDVYLDKEAQTVIISTEQFPAE